MTPLYQEFSFNSPSIYNTKLDTLIKVPTKYSNYNSLLHISLIILVLCAPRMIFNIITSDFNLISEMMQLLLFSILVIALWSMNWSINWIFSLILIFNIIFLIAAVILTPLYTIILMLISFVENILINTKGENLNIKKTNPMYGPLVGILSYFIYRAVKSQWNSSNTIYYSLEQYCNYYNTIDLPEQISTFAKLLNEYIKECESNGKTPVLNDTKYWIKYMEEKKDLSIAEKQMINNLKKC